MMPSILFGVFGLLLAAPLLEDIRLAVGGALSLLAALMSWWVNRRTRARVDR